MRIFIAVGLAIALAGCGDAPASDAGDETELVESGDEFAPDEESYGTDDEFGEQSISYGGDEESERERHFDEDRARDEARADVGSETYSGVGRPYGCTIDCSGHDAGFEWARDRELEDCWGGRSQSFAEGCRTYGEEIDRKVEEARDQFESGADEYSTEW